MQRGGIRLSGYPKKAVTSTLSCRLFAMLPFEGDRFTDRHSGPPVGELIKPAAEPIYNISRNFGIGDDLLMLPSRLGCIDGMFGEKRVLLVDSRQFSSAFLHFSNFLRIGRMHDTESAARGKLSEHSTHDAKFALDDEMRDIVW